MIIIQNKQLNHIPCLSVVNNKKINDPLPTLIYYHGYKSMKEQNLPIAYFLAEKGFRVILPDSKYHGIRSEEISETKLDLMFWEIVIENIKEAEKIYTYLQEHQLLLEDRIGIAGTSMGGITTAGALAKYPWINVAAILMGTPKLIEYAQKLIGEKQEDLSITADVINQTLDRLHMYDLSKHMNKLNDRPLLLWHGKNDSVIPFDYSYSFYVQAKKHYNNSSYIRFIQEENRDHKVSKYAILQTVNWLEQYL